VCDLTGSTPHSIESNLFEQSEIIDPMTSKGKTPHAQYESHLFDSSRISQYKLKDDTAYIVADSMVSTAYGLIRLVQPRNPNYGSLHFTKRQGGHRARHLEGSLLIFTLVYTNIWLTVLMLFTLEVTNLQ
jgi:hypothetical protein